MRPHIRAFVETCRDLLPLQGPIVEIGARLPPSQERLADLRGLFPRLPFIGCDMIAGPGVDRVERVESLSFNTGEVGTFLLCDTLEHVQDVHGAIRELKRCVASHDGVVIATSVMSFPIHGYPNDYWRFTPEAFVSLFSDFERNLVFYGGDPSFPHTVAAIAGSAALLDAYSERLIASLAKICVFAPHHADGISGSTIRTLAGELCKSRLARESNEVLSFGFIGPLSVRGWVIGPGAWIEAELGADDGRAVSYELRCGDKLLMAIAPDQVNIRTYERTRSCFQLDANQTMEVLVGRLELQAIDGAGCRTLLAISEPGVVANQPSFPPGFIFHKAISSAGNAIVPNELSGPDLVAALRGKGVPVVVDLGCGFRKAGSIGIDVTLDGTDADLRCFLGFDPIPLEDASVDEVVCRDFLEHLPKAVFVESRRAFHFPIMFLMDEIWRVLKPGGVFRSWTPVYPHAELFQDPTHLSAWTMNSMGYFCGDYAVARKVYGVRACFEKLEVKEEGFYLYALLRKPEAL